MRRKETKQNFYNKLLRYKIINLHMEMVKAGQYYEARKVLKCLNDGSVKLGLDDISWNVECALEKLGCTIWYSPNGNYSRVYRFNFNGYKYPV